MPDNPTPTAIVTGASSGIGLGIAQALLAGGYNLVATARTISQSTEYQEAPNLVRLDGDLSAKATAVTVAATAVERFGRIDLLVNSAGALLAKPFTEYTEEDFRGLVDTNVASFFYLTQQVIPTMVWQRSGHVVSIGAALVDQPNVAVKAALATLTKATLPAVSRALAIEYAADNLRFNTISPGVVDTPMQAGKDSEALKARQPLHRVASVAEIVEAVLYLTAAPSVTGENLRIDGGTHAGRW